MNQLTNGLILFLSLPAMLLCVFVGFDLPIEILRTSGSQLPYLSVIQWSIGAVLFLVIARRSVRRWMGMQLVNQVQRFVYNQPIAPERKRRVLLYNALEAFLFLALCLGLYFCDRNAYPIYLVYGFALVDTVLFSAIGAKNKWRVGITEKAIVWCDREVKVLYFKGLRKIAQRYETLYFEYIEQLTLDMSFTALADKKAFLNVLKKQIPNEKVFWEESVKQHF